MPQWYVVIVEGYRGARVQGWRGGGFMRSGVWEKSEARTKVRTRIR